jgi:hypothetical protein
VSRLRVLAFASSFVLLLALGLIFRRFLMDGILAPLATAAWLCLRIFVLSIGQDVYWTALLILAVAGALAAAIRRSVARGQPLPPAAAASCHPAEQWRSSILLNTLNHLSEDTLRRDLAWLLADLYSSPYRGEAKYKVRDALRDGGIPLPEAVHSFIFAREPAKRWPGGSLARRNKRASSRYLRSIDQIIAFIEKAPEIAHDERPETRTEP